MQPLPPAAAAETFFGAILFQWNDLKDWNFNWYISAIYEPILMI